MDVFHTFQFPKSERIVRQKLVEALFTESRSRSVSAFPLRAVYCLQASAAVESPVQVLVSVPKKRLHHAVDRNRTKRQIREAWRHNKHLLDVAALPADRSLLVAFVWQADALKATPTIDTCMKTILTRMAERLKQ